MDKKIQLLGLLLSIFTLTSCALFFPKTVINDKEYLKQVSTVHYRNTENIKLPIQINGYYKSVPPDKDMVPGYERVNVFYENGSFASFLINTQGQDDEIIDMEKAIHAAKPLTNIGASYGVYNISNDTIYANVYTKRFYISRLYFIIEDSTTITAFKEDAPLQVYDGKMAVWDGYTKKYHFARAVNIPQPHDHFLRKREWMWDNTKDWQQYMKTGTVRVSL